MPRGLNTHFREIEIRIVSEAAWQPGSPVVEIIKEICKDMGESDSRQEQIMQPYNMFFKRVLHLTAQRILDLGESMQLAEEVIEKIWTIMKTQLSTEPQLLIARHLDQLVMCTVYGVCKVQPGLQISFNNIINKYSDLLRGQRNFQTVYMQVLCANGEKKDIIHFYNDIYIKTMKEYIISMKPGYTPPVPALSIP
jgi:hypothetical protein